MSAQCPSHPSPRPLDALHAAFLAILPVIQSRAHTAFRRLRLHDREDAVAETVGLCWEWFRQRPARGRDAASLTRDAVRRIMAAAPNALSPSPNCQGGRADG